MIKKRTGSVICTKADFEKWNRKDAKYYAKKVAKQDPCNKAVT